MDDNNLNNANNPMDNVNDINANNTNSVMNTGQNESLGSSQAQEGVPQSGEPREGGLPQNGLSGPEKSPERQNGPKMTKKWPWILGILAVVVVLGILVVLLVLKLWESQEKAEGDSGASGEVVGGDESGEEGDKAGSEGDENGGGNGGSAEAEVVKIAVNDPLVLASYGNFVATDPDQENMIFKIELKDKFYSKAAISVNDLTDLEIRRLTLTSLPIIGCKQAAPDYIREKYPTLGGGVNCKGSARNLLRRERSMFGKESVMSLVDGDLILGDGEIGDAVYSATIDTIYNLGGFGLLPSRLIHSVYDAEKQGDRIYVYEKVALASLMDDDNLWICRIEADGCVKLRQLTTDEGNAVLDQGVVPEDQEDWGRYKWTFVKNNEDYVFERLERI